MTFAFVPDDAPPRLIRYVDRGALPVPSMICFLDRENNLLIVDRELFELLDKYQKREVLGTQSPFIEIDHLQHPPALRRAA